MSMLWQTKLAAWIHDPAEKALVLLRDAAGHEGGTVRHLREALAPLIGAAAGARDNPAVKAGDWWAAASDRPQFPFATDENPKRAAWAQVRFASDPVIIHPLSGEAFRLGDLNDAHVEALKTVSLDHFLDLIALGGNDVRLSFLALWRFGPETPAAELNALWQVLPSDTRVPDHSIWNHLDMVSALAGAHEGDRPALLSMSFGPVQGFISQARSTSDLWAGSHLLSSLVWEGIKTLAGEIGPDAVVFPQLRGLAAVDAWLLDEAGKAGKDKAWREKLGEVHPALLESASDANPLFAAALPNKFLAIVPASRAVVLAQRCEAAVREAAHSLARAAGERVMGEDGHWKDQIDTQLAGFPEVHWAVADWPAKVSPGETALAELQTATAAFVADGEDFFARPVWKILSKEIELDGAKFYSPNPGIAYPAVFDLAERGLAAAKSLRTFNQRPQTGYRCTLCGEREWLTPNADWLALPPEARKQQAGNPWPELARSRKFGIKAGEHLCALCATKRLWPTLFAERASKIVGEKVGRYVVSTHTLALATTLERIAHKDDTESRGKLQALRGRTSDQDTVALPRRLLRAVRRSPEEDILRRLPAAFDAARDADDDHAFDELSRRVKEISGAGLETYYGLIQMDGDRMGAWLSGEFATSFRDSWHPQVRATVGNRFGELLRGYLDAQRPVSPGRHAAISQALNDFSARLAPHIVEDRCKGKLLYAGGDDVLAMVAVDDLPKAMLLLRLAYSGVALDDLDAWGMAPDSGLKLKNGFGILDGRLMRLMGGRATASMGAVIAHHQAPLAAVLRTLREAESRAKSAGRNAFCLRVIKRGGGETGFAAPWWQGDAPPAALAGTPFGALLVLRGALIGKGGEDDDRGMSRRAVYLAREWLSRLPEWPGAGLDADWQAMTANRLAAQFARQSGEEIVARDVVAVACRLANGKTSPAALIDDILSTAEFLARDVRASQRSTP